MTKTEKVPWKSNLWYDASQEINVTYTKFQKQRELKRVITDKPEFLKRYNNKNLREV